MSLGIPYNWLHVKCAGASSALSHAGKVLASVDRQKKALRYAGEPTRISFIAIGTPRGLLHGGKDTRKVSQAIQSVGERSSGIMTGKIYRSSHAARLARISRARAGPRISVSCIGFFRMQMHTYEATAILRHTRPIALISCQRFITTVW